MRPIERLEETYYPKGIKLLEYMEEVAVLYVPDYDIDHETGEQYIYGTTALPLFIRRYNQNKLYGNFTYEDYIANEDIQNTLKGLGIDIDKFCMKKKDKSLFKKLFNTTKENKKLATEKKGSFPPFTEPTETKTINNKDEKVESFIYRLRKEQIIQDLPINSKEESRYSGLMSEQEIKESQEKIKTFIKK